MSLAVHCFQDRGTWHVVAREESLAFGDRSSARRHALVIARSNIPSHIVNAPPPGWLGIHSPREDVGASAVADGSTATFFGHTSPQIAGPDSLGRSLLVSPGAMAPSPWEMSRRVKVAEENVADRSFLGLVRHSLFTRERVVYELPSDLDAPEREVVPRDAWSLLPEHDLVAESAWECMTRNAVDARSGELRWHLSAHAKTLGALPSSTSDVLLPDGRPAWLDGGPLRLWTASDLGAPEAVVVPLESLEAGQLNPIVDRPVTAALADDQLDAVGEPSMRVRIIAPAGSGKTRVLTERARHLLRSGVPESVLTLVAFNKRAQLEIVERTRDFPRLQVQTLNALALAIVNGTNEFAPRNERLQTMGELEVRDLLQSMVNFPRKTNTDPAAMWIDALSAVRLGLTNPGLVEQSYNGDVPGFEEFFPRYRDQLRRRGALDFDEQIYRAIEVLLTEPDVRDRAQKRCQVLLVDEFQDLTPAHLLLLRSLAGSGLGIFAVGDDDQTIYGYSGASPEWLVNFETYVPSPRQHALSINYRCPTRVVSAATNLLSRNQFRVSKEIKAAPGSVRADEALRTIESDSPTTATAARVRELLGSGVEPAHIAVLTRVNSLLIPVQAALLEDGIAVHSREAHHFLERTGVAGALSWLRLAVDLDHLTREEIARAARRPSRGISPRVIEWMSEQRDLEGFVKLAGRLSDARDAEKVKAFAEDLRRAGEVVKTASTSEALRFIIHETGLDASMQALSAAQRGRNSAAHSDDLRALVALGNLHPDLGTFRPWLKEVLRGDDVGDGVTLATVHKVKGLEWPHVVVHDVTANLFPHRLSMNVEEERRVFHVAITRAKESLTLVADRAAPSIFLKELAAPLSPADRRGSQSQRGDNEPLLASRRVPQARPTATESRISRSIEARVGLVLQWGGYECIVSEVSDAGVKLTIEAANMSIPFGSEVRMDGATVTLVAPLRSTRRASRQEQRIPRCSRL
jgi:DNA helicase II / ATP-dependent DNA helicase PcrA